MNDRMKLLFLLLVITSQSDIEGWSSGMLEYGSGIETIDLSFEGLDGIQCKLSVTATAQCLMDIKLGNISCPITQDNASPTTTAAVLCMNQTDVMEYTKTITIKHTETATTIIDCPITQDNTSPTTTAVLCMNQTVSVEQIKTITIQHTQTVNNPTIVTICPTPSPSLGSHLMRSSCPVCTPSMVTATIYQQPPIVLSDVVGVSILITSGVLICLPISALLIVTYCWVTTRRTLKKKRSGPEMDFDHSAHDRGVNVSAMTAVKLSNNPAYETQTPLQKNLAYEDTTLTTSKPEESQVLADSAEPEYEIIPLVSVQPASTTTHVLNNGEEDEYDKLNRDTVQKKSCSQ